MMFNFANLLCAEEVAGWISSSFPIIKLVLVCILAVLSIIMIVLVCMQKSNTNGVSAISGQSDTFYNRNKGATLQGKIKIMTIVDACLILVITIAYLILDSIFYGFI